MSAWLLSIVGVIVVGAVLEIMLGESGISKFVKGIYGFFILFVIVSPLPKLIKQASADLKFEIQSLEVSAPEASTSAAVETILGELGIENAVVLTSGDEIYINISGLKTELNADYIKSVISSALNIKKERIEVYE
ncbi:MAG: stage III sporulation protein AF [Christensenellaceae bacterium]|jgi:hypothetical protein|nr:stage III sporulation protein AF [Christensenellaceae bacterium]